MFLRAHIGSFDVTVGRAAETMAGFVPFGGRGGPVVRMEMAMETLLAVVELTHGGSALQSRGMSLRPR